MDEWARMDGVFLTAKNAKNAKGGRECTRMDANAREYGVSGWSKTACRLRVGLSVGLSGCLSGCSALVYCAPSGLHKPCRKLLQSPDTEVRCYENAPGGTGRGAGRFLVLEPRDCRSCRYCFAGTAGTAGTAGGWRPLPTTMPYYWPEQCSAMFAASRDGVAPPVLPRLCRCAPGARRQATTSGLSAMSK